MKESFGRSLQKKLGNPINGATMRSLGNPDLWLDRAHSVGPAGIGKWSMVRDEQPEPFILTR